MLEMDDISKEQVKKKNKDPETGIAEDLHIFVKRKKNLGKEKR